VLDSEKSAEILPARRANPLPPAPKGNQYAKGNKGPRGDFCSKALISQLHEVVKREKVKIEYYKHGGKMKKRRVISQEAHEKIHFIVEALLENAMSGETDAIKYVFDRLEGRPVTTLPGQDDDGVITVRFMPVDNRI
jgi:hypothetical protein